MRRLCWWWRFRACDKILRKTAPTTRGDPARLGLQFCQLCQAQAASVYRHAERGVDIHADQRADFLDGRDAAGRRQLQRCRGSQTAEPVEVSALHHAFFVDVGAEEAGAVWLEGLQRLLGGELDRFAPAPDYDAS